MVRGVTATSTTSWSAKKPETLGFNPGTLPLPIWTLDEAFAGESVEASLKTDFNKDLGGDLRERIDDRQTPNEPPAEPLPPSDVAGRIDLDGQTPAFFQAFMQDALHSDELDRLDIDRQPSPYPSAVSDVVSAFELLESLISSGNPAISSPILG